MKNWTYSFGCGHDHTDIGKSILGGKGYGLTVMSNLGFPVPPGFTIVTDACDTYYKSGKIIPKEIWDQVMEKIRFLESVTGKTFGAGPLPLLLSIRSGAKISMPGMMDTILNLGLNDETTEILGAATDNLRFAYDSYRRFIEMYATVVMGIEHYLFENVLNHTKQQLNIEHDWQLETKSLDKTINDYKKIVLQHAGVALPQDVFEQLRMAISAVFESWNGQRAIKYRKLNNIPDSWGTAVNVQSMVFGNMGADSLTGVLFTRNPSDGEKELFGEFLINAQGEDLVAGIRTPQPVTRKLAGDEPSLEEVNLDIFNQLKGLVLRLEDHFSEMQDIEFTVEKNKLWLLQTRKGKRTAKASIKIAIDIMKEGKINHQEVLDRISPLEIEKLLHHTIGDSVKIEVLTKGLPASPGAASGAVVFSSEEAEELAKRKKVILVRRETSPEDIGGMAVAEGILTTKGGMTSHAAVIARGMGKPCICGADSIIIDEKNNHMIVGQERILGGELITINGATGDVIRGEVATVKQKTFPEFLELMHLADVARRMSIRANAETTKDAETAIDFGANGIGLCRTEHMFFDPIRITAVREMIFAASKEERVAALSKLMPFQKADFKSLFERMYGLPVTIRLLDLPLHEFLPVTRPDIESFAHQIGLSVAEVEIRIKNLHEINPMLGHRGCRLAITFPEIYAMQAQAIFEAAIEVCNVITEIMVPLVFDVKEVEILKNLIEEVHQKTAPQLKYLFGVMVELPRAALQAAEIAKLVDFFSFGTNDLTQTSLGFSRDDVGKFLNRYQEYGIIKGDPFATLDQDGVGELIKIAVERGRAANPKIKIGVCGEHGGDPESIKFFEKIGLDYVSCSPYRIPVARLAAAKATLGKNYNS
ncbi:MAG: pyruvate, phosphate dikinase [Candidatus Midichloria mitochondrii]|nr:pyruvate, phosphate dikinase [Candidatus Midichloria mitochondrii]MDJ1298660.1 pyruvate, phosphate dikinase [Candidatus Midichloria mitochondrii]MDJ1312878.1 pyruvate, phosphate dikinase [Candidatus Midichloria mitochondrii]